MTVKGLASLNRKLTKTIPQKAYDAVRAALANVANDIVAEMKRFAPVDTGDLQMSISWCWGNAPKGAMTLGTVGRKAFKQSKDTNGLRISIYAGGGDQAYAWFVEFGTQNTVAQPFFYPIYRRKKKGAKAKITRAVTKGIKQGAA